MDAFIEPERDISDKNIIFIDDSIVSGATIKYSEKILKEKYKVSDIRFFTVLNIAPEDLSVEDWINRYILQNKTDDLIKLFEETKHFNRYSLKSLFTLDNNAFQLFVTKLSKETISSLHRAATLYYPHGEQDVKIVFVNGFIN
ncbi:hypothetical protein A2641_03035 [Candidatus Nomurabacteria bacterium RIFCSPHIGHO2_01_FULL_37_25]|uniref:Phosphoribosyltransferase domain-containing protein n=1 Tax=Candidatus Nomurabacteria bacterium RIFCSPLOWO2_01_FULL_36_16 TaxID=1801767 RepID=A0A1F6X003_9BACT|nr:MAG: hypothetical protein A2641_03035 [Candidatus Nomurabacteria bacterium RIFCSPHIGHO2_01_FULL_37_25]OGI75467.1 MAG: hypothetical protein A3D36_02680 [Candidatus Nomurabacteria bacterium RIFCSPHIGHO2_02_FULL_36_29]OGI87305.1 MAG: hypothetical protein A3A91_02300 [Candidatus Nomurabacteria bacterium RIFCSPLOWO2_01_FULL_36_16]